MVGFHMMHQNARERVFPLTRANRVGTLLMFVVRKIFSRPELLRTTIRNLVAAGELPQWLTEGSDPLGFLVHESGASTIPDAAYRFVRHESGVDVVLFGTGDLEHLRTNIASILKPPLPEPDRQHGPVRPFGRSRFGRAASFSTSRLTLGSRVRAPLAPAVSPCKPAHQAARIPELLRPAAAARTR